MNINVASTTWILAVRRRLCSIHNLMEDAATAEISRAQGGNGFARPRVCSTMGGRWMRPWCAR